MTIHTALLKRISFLQKISYDEGETIKDESLKDLLTFLENNSKIPTPSLVVTPSGHFRATWGDNNEVGRFSIEFFGSGVLVNTVRFYGKIFSFRSKILEDT